MQLLSPAAPLVPPSIFALAGWLVRAARRQRFSTTAERAKKKKKKVLPNKSTRETDEPGDAVPQLANSAVDCERGGNIAPAQKNELSNSDAFE